MLCDWHVIEITVLCIVVVIRCRSSLGDVIVGLRCHRALSCVIVYVVVCHRRISPLHVLSRVASHFVVCYCVPSLLYLAVVHCKTFILAIIQ